MNAIDLISSPLSESWAAWTLLFLLLILGVVELHQPKQIIDALRDLGSKIERNYNNTNQDLLTTVLLYTFRFGTFALALYLFFYRGEIFTFYNYCIIIGIIIGIELLRSLIIMATHYAFDFRSSLQTFFRQYNNLWLIFVILLYPICIVMMNIGTNLILKIAGGIALSAYLICLILKIIRIAPFKNIHILYISLYLLLLEFVPLGVEIMIVRNLS